MTTHLPADLFAPGAPPAPEPMALLRLLLAEAAKTEPEAGTSMALATVDAEGRPAVRIVLLKGFDLRGFSFFTNYGSRKAAELEATPEAALCFHWPSRAWQLRAEGSVERLSAGESDEYFSTRHRGSQIGAWASRQSEPLETRAALEERIARVEARWGDGVIPRPPFWGGYLLRPRRIEFWQGRESRLHDRWCYEREPGDGAAARWRVRRLFP